MSAPIPEDDKNQVYDALLTTAGIESDAAFGEIDGLVRDIRTKQSAANSGAAARALSGVVSPYNVRGESSLSASSNSVGAVILDDDLKTRLAIYASATTLRPGAFDSNHDHGSALPKPSQEERLERGYTNASQEREAREHQPHQEIYSPIVGLINADRPRPRKQTQQEMLAQIASSLHAEERKGRSNRERDRPIIGPSNEEEPLDNLQMRMNTFINETNKEDEEAKKERYLLKRRKRRRLLLVLIVGLIVMIGVAVGAVIGTVGRSGVYAVDSDSEASSLAACVVGNNAEAVESQRYEALLAFIVSEHPDIEESIADFGSSARKSFCWLVHDDALKIGLIPGNEYLVVQRFTLVLIYYHFVDDANGTTQIPILRGSNWLTGVATCEWQFLSCEDSNERDLVTGLLFVSKRLRGRIPTELALLTALEHIDLAANFLTGMIPSELGMLTQLEVLNLDVNEFEGTFPTEILHLHRLKTLKFGTDFLTGTIPDMSALTNMEWLQVKDSSISGPFPNFSALTNLEKLQFRNVRLTGVLPASYIGSLSKLTDLRLDTVTLHGAIPSELGKVSNVVHLDLSGFSLYSGTIPSEIGRLTSLTYLRLEDLIDLTGTIPSEFGQLSLLESLYFGGARRLEGIMPTEVCSLLSGSLSILTADCERVACECCTKCR